MTQPDLRALAQQENPDAIARWLNQFLQPRGVRARVLIQANQLTILLLADRPLNQQAFVGLLQRQFSDLNLPNLDRVKVYCQPLPGDCPVWTTEFPLTPVMQHEATVPLPAEPPEENHDSSSARSSRQTLPFAVFPMGKIFRRGIYERPIVRLLLFLLLVPLVVNLLAEQISLAQTAWITGTYYAVLWSFLLYHLIKPTRVSWLLAIGCVLFTVLVSIPVLLMLQHLPPFRFLYAATGQGAIGQVLGFVLGIGVLEEFCKAIPLLLLLLIERFRKAADPQTIAFYGAISGLGFAVSESGAYAVQYAIAISRGRLDLGLYLTANTIRFVSLPLFHAVLSGIMGYFIGLALRFPRRRYDLLIWGLAIVATLHGLYNAFSGGLLGTIIIGLSLLLFVGYLDRTPQILQSLAASKNPQRNSRQ